MLVLMSKISTTPREPSESPSKSLPNPNSRLFCNGWRPKPRHDGRQRGGASAPPARLPARPPGQTGQDGAQARTAALEVGSTRDTRFCKQVRAPIRSVTHLWADIVAHANACIKDAFRKPVLRCVARTHSLIGHLEHNSWRRPLRQGSLGQPIDAPGAARLYPVLRSARLFQAERPDLASCQGSRIFRGRAV